MGKRPIAWIASEDRASLILVIRGETLDRLKGQASEAARVQGLTETDFAYGGFVADHIGRSLEGAYQADAARAGVGPTGGGDAPPADDVHDGQSPEVGLVAVSLSSAVAEQLRAHADEDARREGLAGGDDLDAFVDRRFFVDRRMGQRLEAAYNRHA